MKGSLIRIRDWTESKHVFMSQVPCHWHPNAGTTTRNDLHHPIITAAHLLYGTIYHTLQFHGHHCCKGTIAEADKQGLL